MNWSKLVNGVHTVKSVKTVIIVKTVEFYYQSKHACVNIVNQWTYNMHWHNTNTDTINKNKNKHN